MQTSLHLILIFALALAGVPHTFCACGCADGSQQAAKEQPPKATCPHCCHSGETEQPSDLPAPCKCQTCKQPKAVMPSATNAAVILQATTWVDLAVDASPDPANSALPLHGYHGTGPPGFSAVRCCALPILLGHLLL